MIDQLAYARVLGAGGVAARGEVAQLGLEPVLGRGVQPVYRRCGRGERERGRGRERARERESKRERQREGEREGERERGERGHWEGNAPKQLNFGGETRGLNRGRTSRRVRHPDVGCDYSPDYQGSMPPPRSVSGHSRAALKSSTMPWPRIHPCTPRALAYTYTHGRART